MSKEKETKDNITTGIILVIIFAIITLFIISITRPECLQPMLYNRTCWGFKNKMSKEKDLDVKIDFMLELTKTQRIEKENKRLKELYDLWGNKENE